MPAGIAVSDADLGLVGESIHPGFEAVRYVVVTNQFGADKVSLYVLGRLKDGYTVADLAPAAMEVPTGVREGGASPLQAPGETGPVQPPAGQPVPEQTTPGEADPQSSPKASDDQAGG